MSGPEGPSTAASGVDPAPRAAYAALDSDVPCPQCGYNLRGLSGDPVRCPECGGRMPRSAATRHILEEAQRKRSLARKREQKRRERVWARVESGLKICAVSLATGVCAAFLFPAGRDFFEPGDHWPGLITIGCALALGLATHAVACRNLTGAWQLAPRYVLRVLPWAMATVLLWSALICGWFVLSYEFPFGGSVVGGALLVVAARLRPTRPLALFARPVLKPLYDQLEARRRVGSSKAAGGDKA